MLVTVILVLVAVLIIFYLLGPGHVLHFAASYHLGNLRFLLIAVLVLIVFALILRR